MNENETATARRTKPALEVYRCALRNQIRDGLLWGSSLVCLVLMVAALWPSLRDSGTLNDLSGSLPGGTAEAFGLQEFGTPAGYLKGNLYAVLVPLMLCWFGISLATSSTAGDEDAGRLELLLVLPIGRRTVFLARSLASMTTLLLVGIVTWISLIACCALFDLDVSFEGMASVSAMVTLLAMLHVGVTFLVSGWGARRGAVLGITSTVMMAGYVLQAFLPLSDALKDWAQVSPWQWALGADPLSGELDLIAAAALTVLTLVLTALGAQLADRRDVRSV
ncbi:MAG: beta-exotoxin transport system permease protein [Actinomycetota bacterium]|nr:beta-exotoxin transport system permease protein [Actinomycetota bacterium]